MKRVLIGAMAVLAMAAPAFAQSDSMSAPTTSANSMSQSSTQPATSQSMSHMPGDQMATETMKTHKKKKPATANGNMSEPNANGSSMGTQQSSDTSNSMSNPH